MKKKVITFLAVYLTTIVAFPGLYSSARTQSATDGYWQFEKAEQLSIGEGFMKGEEGNNILPREPYDLKKLDGLDITYREGYHRGRRAQVVLTKLEVPETIKADSNQAVISGSGYATLVKELIQQTLGSPPSNPTNFFKFKVEHDGETASGQVLSSLAGHFSGYDHVVHSDKREDFSFSTAGLSVPNPPEDFTVRLLFVVDDRNGAGTLDTWILLFHYKWRTGRPPSDSSNRSSNESNSANASGRWVGNYTNSKGESGKSTITINQLADGTITGDEDGWRIENGQRNRDSLTWQYLRQNNGCRDYRVALQLSNDGQTLIGTYQVTDRCASPSSYGGRYISYKRQ